MRRTTSIGEYAVKEGHEGVILANLQNIRINTFRMQEQENIWKYYNVILQRLRLYCDNPMYFTHSGASPENESQLYALKEGLVNFLAHSDLFSPMHPTIRVFFDRIEFQNPGGFHVSLEIAMTEIVSPPRNPTLINLSFFGSHPAFTGGGQGQGVDRPS